MLRYLLPPTIGLIKQNFKLCNNLKMSSLPTEEGNSLNYIVQILESFAPVCLAEKWDNIGLLIEPHTKTPIQSILLTNDLTQAVMYEAIEKKINLIISYHPPIFSPLKRITQNNWKEKIVTMCLENRIALYSPHTAWDAVDGGVNDWLAKCIPYETISPIIINPLNSSFGMGRIMTVTKPIELDTIIENVKRHINISNVQLSMGCNQNMKSLIKSVAVCAGSGSSVLKDTSTDLYITGEMSHHDLLDAAHRNISVILCNHSNTERGYLNEFKNVLTKYLSKHSIEIIVSSVDADPLLTK